MRHLISIVLVAVVAATAVQAAAKVSTKEQIKFNNSLKAIQLEVNNVVKDVRKKLSTFESAIADDLQVSSEKLRVQADSSANDQFTKVSMKIRIALADVADDLSYNFHDAFVASRPTGRKATDIMSRLRAAGTAMKKRLDTLNAKVTKELAALTKANPTASRKAAIAKVQKSVNDQIKNTSQLVDHGIGLTKSTLAKIIDKMGL